MAPPNTSYKMQSEGWKWYASHVTRPEHCPPFTMEGESQVAIPNGEMFCRFNLNHNTDQPAQLCYRTEKQDHWANLKRHVESHRVTVGDTDVPVTLTKNRTGGLTMQDHQRLIQYWDTLKQHIDQYNPLDEDEPKPVKTPTRPDIRPPHAPKTKDLLVVPMTKRRKGSPPHPNLRIMMAMVNQKRKVCKACELAGKAECPTTRKHYCQLWSRFKVHPKEPAEEVSDADDEDSDERSPTPSPNTQQNRRITDSQVAPSDNEQVEQQQNTRVTRANTRRIDTTVVDGVSNAVIDTFAGMQGNFLNNS
ncbi:hypothetical protein F5Y06DRAFT_267540 [Hypoxylon sp. FL0890]|nr:hypothetical protein F5Y06DRAFT_267540 [Hypoxylon sp. FL0890]